MKKPKKYGRGKNPNSRNGFKANNSKGTYLHPDKVEDDRRLWFFKFAYGRRAKRKGLTMSITQLEFLQIVKSNCHYCNKSYLDETRNVNQRNVNMLTVDRMDSSLGYTLDNCVPCCKMCNTIKMDQSYDSFIERIRTIHKHLKL